MTKKLHPTLLRTLMFTVAWFSCAASAMSVDADFQPLLKARNLAGVEALAQERMTVNSKDDVAIWYLGRMVAGDTNKRVALLTRVEQCIKDLPQSARCHHTLGSLYGAMALSGGMTAGIKYAGRIKEMYLKAVALDPKNYTMRRDLNQFYLMAPGMAGGSVSKAVTNSHEFAKIDPLRSQLLLAEVQIYEKKFTQAESTIKAVIPGADADLAETILNGTTSLGFAMINNNEAAKAQKLFEQLIAAAPTNATVHFGLGRALLEQNNFNGAIAAIERALQIEPKLTGHYRLALAYQGKGDEAKAIADYHKFLSYQTSGKAADDAKKRLADLQRR